MALRPAKSKITSKPEASGGLSDAGGKAVSAVTGDSDEVFGPSTNPATNLVIQDVAMRAGGRLMRHTLEKGLLRGRYGGSGATHPEVIERLAGLADIPVRYLGWEQAGEVMAAIPCWGRYLALSKDVLKKTGKRGLFDLGNAEVILPIAEQACVPVRQRMRYVSELNAGRISALRDQPEGLALAREPEDYSKKFRYNQRREQRLLEEAGGVLRPAGRSAGARPIPAASRRPCSRRRRRP